MYLIFVTVTPFALIALSIVTPFALIALSIKIEFTMDRSLSTHSTWNCDSKELISTVK